VTPLERLIRARIAEEGPMPVETFMGLALQHPEHGYYITRDPLGAHFTTAPEVSQLFGEMIGGWLCQAWLDAGRPDPVRLVELGPGRGTLMADALRVIARVPAMAVALDLWLVETSPVLRAAQAARLPRARWADRLDAVPDGPLLLVANELFDALPVAQVRRLDEGWQERVVTLEAGRLAFGFGPVAHRPELDSRFPLLPAGVIVEHAPAAEALAAEIGRRLREAGGAALVLDYGEWDGAGDTLQAIGPAGRADPLAAPGEADLTAHVRFRALAEAAAAAAFGPVPQGAFLERLGITARARALARGREGPALEAVVAGHRRLTDPSAMGQVFKAMALLPPGAPVPAGFAGPTPDA
jgi:SAM-dependent MidA family methyltransferase